MNMIHNHKKLVILIAGTLGLGLATFVAGAVSAPHRRGTDILHFFVRKAMTNEVATAATARVDVRQNHQGRANIQTLDITVRYLDTNTPYLLLASFVDDTNLTQVAGFNTDSRGRALLRYRQQETGNGKAVGLGRGKLPLPAALNPVSELRQLAICDTNTNTVLFADLSLPDSLQYLIKRDISNSNAVASLQIIANLRHTQFRLFASGLNPSSDYLLGLNGGVVQTNVSDAKGRLFIRSLMESPLDVLDVRSVELWDAGTNEVLSTQLP